MSQDTQPHEDEQGLKPDPALLETGRTNLVRIVVLGSLGLAALIALLVTLVLPLLLEPSTSPTSSKGTPTPQPAAGVAHKAAPKLYEEPLAADLQEQAIRADVLVTRTLIELDAEADSIEAFAFPAKGSEDFRARSLGFALPCEPKVLETRLAALLAAELPSAVLAPSGPRQYSIIIDGVRTHELFLDLPEKTAHYTPNVTALTPEVTGRLAIVIDDMGEDTRLARGLADTGLDLTFAVWPSSSHKDTVRALARENKLDLLVHLPMEPRGYPEMQPGPDALFVDMTAEQIQDLVKMNLDRVPEAIGVNNHMGSRFTADEAGMTAALDVISRRGLFFLDSRTTGKSRAPSAARATGTPMYGRDVFLDNELDVGYILKQLRKAENIARRRGMAIAIGHPHQQTLQAIRQWAAAAKGDVAVVRISALPVP